MRHGMTGTRAYRAWQGMKRRCYNKAHPSYTNYGGNGITVFAPWINDFQLFYGHIGPCPSDDHSVDRIDNAKSYVPGNVRWATHKEQQNNRTNNLLVSYRGGSMTLAQAVERAGSVIAQERARGRIVKLGWSVEKAVETPARPLSGEGGPTAKLTDAQVAMICSSTLSAIELAAQLSVSASHIRRIRQGATRKTISAALSPTEPAGRGG